ncbi:hypothetical protein EYF80_058112 [Liparis tanakae]|uniref:Uncharacterized protein n=1 Tax=Liparis tanakae TaxID=230148 RepID=A0A4Z2ET29_9TELE|nr:hypothetical protein EYF80_058112 [Liparis tanakae]
MERWPIAPDGYIPNSVIRGWGKKRKRLPQTDELDDLFSGGHREKARKKESECEEDVDEDEEEEVEEEEKAKVGMSERSVLLKESYIVRTKIRQQKTSDGGRMEVEPRRQTVGYGSTKAESFGTQDHLIHTTKRDPKLDSSFSEASISNPINPQHQPDFGPPEISPIRCNWILLCSTKYNNIGNQTQVPLDRRVLELHKKFKVYNKNSLGLGKTSIITEPPLAFPYSTVQSDSAGLKSDWRKNLHNPRQGFSSPPSARALPVESSNAGEFSPINPSLCPGEGAVHQRVVQRILMKDSLDPPSFHFHHVIPLNAQQTFFPLNPSGKTRYGRLQFDWMRGRDEGQLWLEPSRQRSALYDLSRST